jgi:hypothetical protein
MPHDRDDAIHATRPPGWYEGSEQGGSQPGAELASEDEIVQFVNKTCWKNWMPAHRAWHRQVEENVRMLSGAQYDYFIETIGDFVDMSQWFISADERWRQAPVFNWLAHYYKLTLSKLTENLPTIGWLPASADHADAVLARVMEPIWKYQWNQMRMPEKMFMLYGWVIVAARGVTKLRWDPDRGPAEEYRGNALFESFAGGQLTQRDISDAPYLRQNDGTFEPAFLSGPDGNPLVEDGEPVFGQGHSSRLGDLDFSILTPTAVITSLGPEPFDDKPWYTEEYLLPVDEVQRRFSIEVEPEEIDPDDDLTLKLAYGAHYGMPDSSIFQIGIGGIERESIKGFIRVKEHWRREVPNHATLSRGRLMIVTKDKVLYDDINPFWVDGSHERTVMPYDAFEAIPVPFRNEGMGDLEILNPLQRAMNRRMHGALDAVDYNEQPVTVYNENVLAEEDMEHVNKPGAQIAGNLTPGVGDPMWRFPPTALPSGSMEMADRLRNWMETLGSQSLGAEGQPVTTDASGELQREVRFDQDRVWGATVRLHSYVWARIAEKMGDVMAACLTDDRLLVLSGEDQAVEFIEVSAQLFKGRVHAYPNPESQVLESRQEKQNRILALVGAQLVPPEQAMKALNYPDLERAMRPGGPAYDMAQRENLELLLGQLAPVLPEHDHATHMLVHLNFMQTVTFRDLDPQLQDLFRLHKFLHQQMAAAQLMEQAALMAQAVTGGDGGAGEGAAPGGADRAPTGTELEQGAVAPGGADPRRTSIKLQA